MTSRDSNVTISSALDPAPARKPRGDGFVGLLLGAVLLYFVGVGLIAIASVVLR